MTVALVCGGWFVLGTLVGMLVTAAHWRRRLQDSLACVTRDEAAHIELESASTVLRRLLGWAP